MVAFHWGYSLSAGVIVLSVLVVPYVTKTTEVAMRSVPTSYREGGEALGMRSGYMLRKLVLRPALPGIATGLIMAAGHLRGETAPLLLHRRLQPEVAHLRHSTHSPVGYLTYLVFTDYNQPSTFLAQRADAAALLLIVLVLVLIVIARVVVMVTQRYSPDRPQRLGKATAVSEAVTARTDQHEARRAQSASSWWRTRSPTARRCRPGCPRRDSTSSWPPTALDGLRQFAAHPPDLVLLDVLLPGHAGYRGVPAHAGHRARAR